MADADQKAVEVVGELVQWRDRVAHFDVVVGARVADVVRDWVNDEEADTAELA